MAHPGSIFDHSAAALLACAAVPLVVHQRRAMGLIRQYVPPLRRFARALTGSRRLGDDAVTATLRFLLDGHIRFASEVPPKIALYKAFFDAWTHAPPPATGEWPDDERLLPADRRLQSIPQLDRAAFLLAAMDGFDEREIAIITDMAAGIVEAILERAETRLEAQMATRVLLVIPDFRTAGDLFRSIQSLGHMVVGQATRVDTIIAQTAILRPGLIVAARTDERRTLTVVNRASQRYRVPVVHVCDRPERLLTGAVHEPTFLVHEPLDEISLRAMISQALFFEEGRES